MVAYNGKVLCCRWGHLKNVCPNNCWLIYWLSISYKCYSLLPSAESDADNCYKCRFTSVRPRLPQYYVVGIHFCVPRTKKREKDDAFQKSPETANQPSTSKKQKNKSVSNKFFSNFLSPTNRPRAKNVEQKKYKTVLLQFFFQTFCRQPTVYEPKKLSKKSIK